MSGWVLPKDAQGWRDLANDLAGALMGRPCLGHDARGLPCLPCRASAVNRARWREHITERERLGVEVPGFCAERAAAPVPCLDEGNDHG